MTQLKYKIAIDGNLKNGGVFKWGMALIKTKGVSKIKYDLEGMIAAWSEVGIFA